MRNRLFLIAEKISNQVQRTKSHNLNFLEDQQILTVDLFY